jgi:hypothetical protein
LLVLFGLAGPSLAEDGKVTVRFLGGAKKLPLAGLKVTIRAHTGDWTRDHKTKLTDGKTDKDGNARFTLADGLYYAEIGSEKELPYLNIPMGYKAPASIYGRYIKVGKERAFEFNLADACKLTLRAVDADTGKGIPGVSFSMESQTGESRDVVLGDNIGVDSRRQRQEVTDQDGYLVRYMGPWEGYTYFAWPTPEGYEPVGEFDAAIPTRLGTATAEHVFKFKKK